MSNYFVLECYGPMDADRAAIDEVVDDGGVSWNLGTPITASVPTPIEVRLDADEPGLLMPMFDCGILLMRDDLISALHSAGVDNLDLYPCVLLDPATGERHQNYKAVNIIGTVCAADLGKSAYIAPHGSALIDTDFDSLAIDEEKAHGLLFFRLAECVSAKVIHHKVKSVLEKKFPDLDFVNPEEWMG